MASRRFERAYLDRQADRIERALSAMALPVRVHGGQVARKQVRFHLAPVAGTRVDDLEEVAEAVADAMGVDAVRFQSDQDNLTIDMPLSYESDLRLLPLLHSLDRLPGLHALLGMSMQGRPLVLNFSDPNSWHLLVSGPDGCGKSELLRTALLSLALSHRRSQVQVMGIDLGGREMVVLEALPHALTDVGTERDFSIELLAWLADEVERRFASGIQYPHVFLLIDDLAALFGRPDSELLDNLLFLIENGRSAGLHLILACDEDFAASLQADCLANGTVEARGLADEGRETPVGLFEFRISGRTKRAHIGWMSARDLDTAINLAQAGWRVGLGQTPEELER